MFIENNRSSAVNRANDAFLRHLQGGELRAESVKPSPPCNQGDLAETPNHASHSKCLCGHKNRPAESAKTPCGCPSSQQPALAMVYSPFQNWQKLYPPDIALSRGTMFEELDLPLEVGKKEGGCCRRPL